jgi:hypothetical protein
MILLSFSFCLLLFAAIRMLSLRERHETGAFPHLGPLPPR